MGATTDGVAALAALTFEFASGRQLAVFISREDADDLLELLPEVLREMDRLWVQRN